jgi:hypothetical protein
MTATLPPMVASSIALGATDTPRARRTDPVTSHEAADTSDVSRSIGLVLDILLNSAEPLTDEQIEYVAVVERNETFTGQRLRTARNALVRLEQVVMADKHGGRTSRGRWSATWSAVKS